MTVYNFSQLENLWMQGGGSALSAPIAAAIGLAESGGNSDEISKTNDWGVWQINNGGQAMLDPLANAQRAVSMSGNGANWRPWCSAWSDHACGTLGGTYLGTGSPFYVHLPNGMGTTPGTDQSIQSAANPAPNATLTSTSSDCLIHIPSNLPSWIPFFGSGKTPCLFPRSWGRALLGGASILGGAITLTIGIILLFTDTQTAGQALRKIIPATSAVA